MNPGSPFDQAPGRELFGEAHEPELHDEIGQVRARIGNSSQEFVTSNTRQHRSVAAAAHNGSTLISKFPSGAESSGQRAELGVFQRCRRTPQLAICQCGCRFFHASAGSSGSKSNHLRSVRCRRNKRSCRDGGRCFPSLERMSSAMQTIEDESSPPLSSARIGESERNLRRTHCRNRWRKCSSYSASVL